ncbi:hypothetical protein [Stakelama tenebrarum]|uniref:Uncharacterized protein n=1 Tax=Stakelama tenebrarum TaxID=2711215 RepID=A0A6G6Y2T9_9SPHN|nr:hypothetical protein [Sphingosinithalassobacter tenebrarum]QIG79242.1 hypothetical protein G5C33_05165 [Sphingosinithalassobacter tenebrarum]
MVPESRAQDSDATSESEEIRVLGLPAGDPPVDIENGDGRRARVSRSVAGDAQRFVRCLRRVDTATLREMMRALPESRPRAIALDRIIRRNTGCVSGLPTQLMASPPYYGVCNPVYYGDLPHEKVCHAFYDFGALVEEILETYAGDLVLTSVDTRNRHVAARFLARQSERNASRSGTGREFFDVAACLVQLHPERALQLIRAEPGSDTEARLRGYLLGYSEGCLGRATEVRVDPSQFRVYIAEAVHEWALAAMNVETLIPEEDD